MKEIQDLNASLAEFKKQTEEEISNLKAERDEALQKNESNPKEIVTLKAKVKRLQDDLSRA